jgi:hypothetical protein
VENLKRRKRPLRRPRHRWDGNIRTDLREIGSEDVNWMNLAQDRDQCEHGNEPSGSIKGREFLDWLSDC